MADSKKRIDGFYIKLDKEDKIIIHQYKRGNFQNKDKKLKEGILQILKNGYFTTALNIKINKKHDNNQNNEWKKLIIRTICFYTSDKKGKNNVEKKWDVVIKSYKFNRKTVKNLNELLSKIPKYEINLKNTTSNKIMKEQEKVIINALMNMNSNNDKIDNIFDILDKISINKNKNNFTNISNKIHLSKNQIEKVLFEIKDLNDRKIILPILLPYFYNSRKEQYTKKEFLSIIEKFEHKLKTINLESIKNLINFHFKDCDEKVKNKINFKKDEQSKKRKLK